MQGMGQAWWNMQSMDRTENTGFWWQDAWGRRFPVAVAVHDGAVEISGHAPLCLPIKELASTSFHVPTFYQNEDEERRWIIVLRDTSGRDWKVHAPLDATEQVQTVFHALAVALHDDGRLQDLSVGPPRPETVFCGGIGLVGALLIALGGALVLVGAVEGLGVLVLALVMSGIGLIGWRRRRRSFSALEEALAFNLHPKA